MGSSWGRYFTVTTFGESHGAAVGVIIDGVPPGLAMTVDQIQVDLDRRRPGASDFVSPRKETDQAEVLSGLVDGKTMGTPLCVVVRNRDVRSKDYDRIRELFRPGHADYSYFKKYGLPPQPGGGRSSGRETVGRVAAGAVARALLASYGVDIRAFTAAVGDVVGRNVDPDFVEKNPVRCADPDRFESMAAAIAAARESRDSIGGIVEVRAEGVPAGWGDPVFYKLDAMFGLGMLSIGGVKGVEIGDGFGLTTMRGSQANDQLTAEGFLSNRAGGILGGISTGQEIIIRLAVKPTSSIGHPQSTIDLTGRTATIETHGRHDPCLCPRIAPVAEAMAALVLADACLEHKAHLGGVL
jgi:chorismate synthase